MPRKSPPSDQQMLPLTVTLVEASRLSGLSKSTLRRRNAEGKITLLKADGLVLVEMASLRSYLASRPVLATSA